MLVSRNRFGAIAFEPGNQGQLLASTQLFQSGEIWAINGTLIIQERGERPETFPIPLIPYRLFERKYFQTLNALLAFSRDQLHIDGPWQVELGCTGLARVPLAVQEFGSPWGPIYQDEVFLRRLLRDASPESVNPVLLEFFCLMCDASGYPTRGLLRFPAGAAGVNIEK
jgi:hypothetical protein